VEDETIEILLDLWTRQSVTYEGTFFKLTDVEMYPKPYRKPHPPILIGGTAKYATRRVVKFGGGWLPFCPTVEDFGAGVNDIKRVYREADKDFDKLVMAVDLWGSIHREGGTARKRAEFLVRYFSQPLDRIEEKCAIGSPDEAADRLRMYVELGASHIILGFPPAGREKEHMDLLVDEVIDRI
jgi:alkanesulfonate monooxygenase SsuD/methylene tetrahydromethanopterin reductase-like flavin-dependent oxidoreductase (luciferase family)